jgi:ABC-type Mn2+/Zn2+ transport system ATPase subunit
MITELVGKHCNVLELSGVTLGYPGILALKNVSFNVCSGEFIGIIGPNGSGKSTVLKGILGLLPILAGEIRVFGRSQSELKTVRKMFGYVPQKHKNDLEFPTLVREVVMMGLYAQIGLLRKPKKQHLEWVDESLRLVGLSHLKERAFGELSGGQQQRVLIARAIASRPQLLMLDEPTSAVDIKAKYEILELIEALNREHGLTVLIVSHDVNEIVHFADKVLLLNGEVVGYGTPNDVLTKENLRAVYGDHIMVYDHNGHPHVLAGDFN